MFTVKELLQDCCPELTILNANADLSRQVFAADISETPDIAHYIAENTLLITTGMAFRDHPEELADFIKELNQQSVPALAIKLGRFIHALPPIVIETANMLQFPILQIPPEFTLGMVSHSILSYIWYSQANTLVHAIEVQREFSSLVLKNIPVYSLIDHLSKLLGHSVLLLNPFLQVEALSQNSETDKQLLNQAIKTIYNYYVYPRDKLVQKDFYLSKVDDRNISVSVYPVKVDQYQIYLLAVFNATEISYPFSKLVLEQFTITLAFVQYKQHMINSNDLQTKEMFFHQLQRSHSNSESFFTALNRYENWYGLGRQGYFQAVVIGIDDYEKYCDPAEMEYIVYQWLAQESLQVFTQSVVFPLFTQQCFVIVLQQAEPELSSLLSELANRLNNYYPFVLSFGIGSSVDGLDSLWFSYLKATETYNQAREEGQRKFVKQYYIQAMQDIMQFVPPEHAGYFATFILKDLAIPTNKLNQELRLTLETYMNFQGDLSQTSQQLFLHRNTVRYRIQRIEKLLGADLRNPETSLNIRMALLLAPYNY